MRLRREVLSRATVRGGGATGVVLTLCAGAALLTAGCGADSGDGASGKTSAETAASEPAAPGEAAAELPPLPAAVVDPALLAPAELRYAVRVESGDKELAGTSQRSVRRETQDGRDVWRVSTETDIGSGSKDVFILDATTLAPLSREATEGESRLALTFDGSAVEGSLRLGSRDVPIAVALDVPVMADTSALEWVMTGWPLAEGYAATAHTFDALARRVRRWSFGVAGSESVTVPAGTFDAYKIQMLPTDGSLGLATLWVSKDPPRHLVRSETVMPGVAVRSELVSIGGS
jgi:hypothetical protein